MPFITTHLPVLDDSILHKPSLADFPSSKPTPPALPPRSSLRTSRNLSSMALTTSIITKPTSSRPPSLSPTPNPYDSYLSEEDASDSADDDDYDISTISLAYPHDDREAIARIVEFTSVGKPTIISISSRPTTAESLHYAIPYPPPAPPRPRTHSIASAPAPAYPNLPASRSTASLPDATTRLSRGEERPLLLRQRMAGIGAAGARRLGLGRRGGSVDIPARERGLRTGKYSYEDGAPERQSGEGGEMRSAALARVRSGMRFGLGRRSSVRG